jgi:hypothetical protein
MRLAENEEDGEVNAPLQRPVRTFFSNLLSRQALHRRAGKFGGSAGLVGWGVVVSWQMRPLDLIGLN